MERKVRTPNKLGTHGHHGGRKSRKVPQKITAAQFFSRDGAVRVKTCGKSTRRGAAMHCGGKPYLEQGKIAYVDRLFRLNMRVCRQDKWLPSALICCIQTARQQNPAYSPPCRCACVIPPLFFEGWHFFHSFPILLIRLVGLPPIASLFLPYGS